MSHWPWSVLGIEATDDKGAIRKAYATKLKSLDIDQEIAAFSDLRQARDSALSQAEHQAASGLSDDLDDDDYFSDSDGQGFDFELFGAADLQGFSFEGPRDFGGGLSDISGDGDDGPVGVSDKKLSQLLFPGGERSDDAMEWDDYETATAELTALLDHASMADLETEQSIDYWLADILADAWPRSAPLVEQASQALGWTSEEGQISERSSLVWLNARLRGMQYHAVISEPDHPKYKAWAYLTEEGEYRWWDSTKFSRTDANEIIENIHSDYPELEAYLEPRKVAALAEGGTMGFVPGLIRLLFVLFLLSIPLRHCSGTDSAEQDPVPIVVDVSSAGVDSQLSTFVEELFGQEASREKLEQLDPELAQQLRALAVRKLETKRLSSASTAIAISKVRTKVFRATATAGFDDLLDLKALQLAMMRAARRVDADQCAYFATEHSLGGQVELSEDVRATERALSWRFVEAGLTSSYDPEVLRTTATVPGWVISDVIKATNYSDETVRHILGGGRGEDVCGVKIALLDAVLRKPGRVSVNLLRLL